MNEDLIKRSDAIKAIASLHILADEEKIFKVYADNPHSMTTDFEETLIDAINAIKGIPTIEPKRPEECWGCNCEKINPKRGEWIEVSFNEKIKYMVCSECGNKYAVDLIVPLEAWIDEKHKFCGLCGADMREREGE